MAATLAAQETTPVGKLPIAQLQKLAETGDPAAQNELGVRYRMGTDVEKDPAKAVSWYLKAARQGYATAYFNLGAAYYNGDGVPANDQDSCVWFILAADAGDQRGQEALARTRQEMSKSRMTRCGVLAATAYLTGDLVRQDYAKAMQWYQNAAAAGDGLACERIAYLHNRGLGVAADKQQGFDWLKRSADLGYAPAIYELGREYELGEAIQKDPQQATKLYSKAKKLYEEAASQGEPEGLLALGNMYAEGHGVKPDRRKALMYYIVAANCGSRQAQIQADEVAAQMTPKQVASAKQDAGRFVVTSKHPVLSVRK